jgi:hypothetical protein
LQGLQVLGVVLRHKAAFSAGTLLMWALQRPELIDMGHADSAEASQGTTRTLTGLLLQSSRCLELMAVVFVHMHIDPVSSRSTTIGRYAAAMSQQLEQSGTLQMTLRSCNI